ncbi:MAG TPA: TonB-dependent receptor [Candidatus Polarisedimenticolia bacterium]|nr:TonB-dependent receptor [Candidatus Polarisedimenticolia bacterium]
MATFAAAALCFSPRADAADRGALQGRVIDPAGNPLPGATVSLIPPWLGTAESGAVTDARGEFRISGLPAGRGYQLRCAMPGFATTVLSDIDIPPGAETRLTVALAPADALVEEVRVRAAPPIVSLTETTTQSRFSSEFIDALPILGRNYQDVLTLAPGVSDLDGDGNPNIHGARDTDVITLVDGVSTTDPFTGKVGAQLNIESIQEIEVKTSGATAEFGRAQGGFANIITKSGGNQFEGSFKFFWRGSALDGDGAGIDDPSLHASVGEKGLRDLEFNDFLPFLSLSGPIVRDRAWYFVTLEYIQREDPVNAVNTAFVTGLKEYRGFAKATWQVAPATRLALSLNYDPQDYLNQGLNSLTREETGFTLGAGGTNISIRSVSTLSPSVVLEGTIGFLDTRPSLTPNLGADTNGNGVMYVDRNGDGFTQASERDPGEDYDGDGAWDVWEDTYCVDRTASLPCRNGILDVWNEPEGVFHTEDVDGDGRLTPYGTCEGTTREDIDCDGHRDDVDEDVNGNGRLDGTEDLDGDRFLDRGGEDRNGNLVLDDTPFPTGDYPYGALRPQKQDRDYFVNETTGITEGPYYETLEDTRRRATVRADLSVFVPDFRGSHDLRLGGIFERESFDRTTGRHDIIGLQPPVAPLCDPEFGGCIGGRSASLAVVLPAERTVDGAADGSTGALYVHDSWRPLPNLSLGLGLRYERETARAPGFTFFDPRQQRDTFDALVTLSGGELGRDDLRLGNRDGLANQGILGDPMVYGGDGGLSGFGADLINALRLQAIRHLLRHRSNLEYSLGGLRGLYSDLGTGDEIDPARLSALGVTTQQPEAFALTNDNLSPRLSVSWDPAANGLTKVFATWGRYFDKLFLSTIVGEQGPDTVARYYEFDPDGVDVDLLVQQGFRATPDHHVGRIFGKSPPSIRQVDRDLATPYSDEWTVGIEREVAPEVALALRFIRRDFRDQLQDTDINHEMPTDPVTGGAYDLFGILFEIPIRPPGAPGRGSNVQLPDGRPDLFIQNPFFNQVLRVENANTARYSAFEIELRRRMRRRWELQGSYVYSRAQGNAEDFQSKVGNDPSVTESEYGYLAYDQRHVVKINAAVFLPKDVQLGIVTSWASGPPYSVIARFFAFDNTGYLQFRTLFGYTKVEDGAFRFVPLPRNSERNDAVLNVNLALRKSFVIGRNLAGVSLEVDNLLNSDDLRVITYEPVNGSGYDLGGLSPVTPLQLDATRRFGRRFQIGFQFAF